MYLNAKAAGEVAATEFLSAEALQITEPQRDALIEVLARMEDGRIRPERFYMNLWNAGGEGCGTVHCIGGWAEMIAGEELFQSTKDVRSQELADLFYPNIFRAAECTDPRRGALALRSFLTTREAQWAAAMDARLE